MRLCIIGPSNSGKSTLAQRLAAEFGVPCYHLDQLAHVPGTAWQPRPASEWHPAHDAIIATDHWIIDGNYKNCMPRRFARADAVLWLDLPLAGCLWRYAKRCLDNNINRPGRLENAQKEFSWQLVRYTLRQYPVNRRHYTALIKAASVSCLHLERFHQVKKFQYDINKFNILP